MNARILIATPAAGGQVTTEYLQSVAGLLEHFRDRHPGIRFVVQTRSLAVVYLARNMLATAVLADAEFTHLLFVDADMGFDPVLIERMLQSSHPVVGVAAPHRSIDFGHLWDMAHQVGRDALASVAATYVGEYVGQPGGGLQVVDGFVRASVAGTGILLVQRAVLQRIAELPGMIGASPWDASVRQLQCFNPTTAANGALQGEDVAFSRRWVEGCGGEIWIDVVDAVTHVGPTAFKGRMIDVLEARFKRTPG